MTQIAFIGLGAMGSGMAINLVKSKYDVMAYDVNTAAIAPVVAAGSWVGETIAETVKHADVIITMLPTGAHVKDVYLREGGVLANAKSGALMLDCSTIAVEDARHVGTAVEKAGFTFCDAPVSGGVAAAANAMLTFMVGGSEEGFARANPILSDMGKAVIHAGALGAGQSAKICNNMLLAVSMIGTCEAFVLAEKLGLDAQAFFDIASKSSGQCWSMTSYAPVPGLVETAPSNRDFTGGFAGALMLKDLRLAMEAARSVAADTPMGMKAEDIYSKYVSNYNPDRDFSGVIDMLREK